MAAILGKAGGIKTAPMKVVWSRRRYGIWSRCESTLRSTRRKSQRAFFKLSIYFRPNPGWDGRAGRLAPASSSSRTPPKSFPIGFGASGWS